MQWSTIFIEWQYSNVTFLSFFAEEEEEEEERNGRTQYGNSERHITWGLCLGHTCSVAKCPLPARTAVNVCFLVLAQPSFHLCFKKKQLSLRNDDGSYRNVLVKHCLTRSTKHGSSSSMPDLSN